MSMTGSDRDDFDGFSINWIADHCGKNRKIVTEVIKKNAILPVGKGPNGYPVYTLKSVLPFLYESSEPGFEGSYQVDLLPPDLRDKHFASELKELKVKRERRELIPVHEHYRSLSESYKELARFLDALPDVLEREINLTPEQVEGIQSSCDVKREELFQIMVLPIEVPEQDPEDSIE